MNNCSCLNSSFSLFLFFLSIWVFFHGHSRITGLHGKAEGISLTPHYHSRPLHRHLDISQVITAESSPLHIASSRTRTGNLCFSSKGSRAQVANHEATRLYFVTTCEKKHVRTLTAEPPPSPIRTVRSFLGPFLTLKPSNIV